MNESTEHFIPSENAFSYLPKRPFSFSPDRVNMKSLNKEEDSSRRDQEKSNHGSNGDAYDQGLRDKLLTVLTTIPPVLTDPASATDNRAKIQATPITVQLYRGAFSGTGKGREISTDP